MQSSPSSSDRCSLPHSLLRELSLRKHSSSAVTILLSFEVDLFVMRLMPRIFRLKFATSRRVASFCSCATTQHSYIQFPSSCRRTPFAMNPAQHMRDPASGVSPSLVSTPPNWTSRTSSLTAKHSCLICISSPSTDTQSTITRHWRRSSHTSLKHPRSSEISRLCNGNSSRRQWTGR